VSHPVLPPDRFVRNKAYGRGSTETGNETCARDSAPLANPAEAHRRRSQARRMRDSNSRGVAPNTLSNNVACCSRPVTTVRDLRAHLSVAVRERCRTEVNETTFETRPGSGLAPGLAAPRCCRKLRWCPLTSASCCPYSEALRLSVVLLSAEPRHCGPARRLARPTSSRSPSALDAGTVVPIFSRSDLAWLGGSLPGCPGRPRCGRVC
jgi:hypothetical protein